MPVEATSVTLSDAMAETGPWHCPPLAFMLQLYRRDAASVLSNTSTSAACSPNAAATLPPVERRRTSSRKITRSEAILELAAQVVERRPGETAWYGVHDTDTEAAELACSAAATSSPVARDDAGSTTATGPTNARSTAVLQSSPVNDGSHVHVHCPLRPRSATRLPCPLQLRRAEHRAYDSGPSSSCAYTVNPGAGPNANDSGSATMLAIAAAWYRMHHERFALIAKTVVPMAMARERHSLSPNVTFVVFSAAPVAGSGTTSHSTAYQTKQRASSCPSGQSSTLSQIDWSCTAVKSASQTSVCDVSATVAFGSILVSKCAIEANAYGQKSPVPTPCGAVTRTCVALTLLPAIFSGPTKQGRNVRHLPSCDGRPAKPRVPPQRLVAIVATDPVVSLMAKRSTVIEFAVMNVWVTETVTKFAAAGRGSVHDAEASPR